MSPGLRPCRGETTEQAGLAKDVETSMGRPQEAVVAAGGRLEKNLRAVGAIQKLPREDYNSKAVELACVTDNLLMIRYCCSSRPSSCGCL